jgi:hypothetical protein
VSDEEPISIRDAHREIEALKELLEQQIRTLELTLTARLDAMDKALTLAGDQTKPIIQQIDNRLTDRLVLYQSDRAEILRRLKDIEALVRKTNGRQRSDEYPKS